jgi:hypothetical protein
VSYEQQSGQSELNFSFDHFDQANQRSKKGFAMESLRVLRVEEALAQWGLWVRSGRQLPGLADTQQRRGSRSSNLSDDEAGMVDRAVAQLKLNDRLAGEAVFTYHVAEVSMRSVAKVMNISLSKAELLIRKGEGWVAGYLAEKES